MGTAGSHFSLQELVFLWLMLLVQLKAALELDLARVLVHLQLNTRHVAIFERPTAPILPQSLVNRSYCK